MITVDQLFSLTARQQEVVKRVRNGGLSIDNALEGTQGILEGKYPPRRPEHPEWYVEAAQQIRVVKTFLDKCGVVVEIPSPPQDFVSQTPTEVLMLAVYLTERTGTPGVQRTFETWWNFIRAPEGFDKHLWENFSSDEKSLRLLTNEPQSKFAELMAIEHRPGIRWVGFDPNTYMGVSVSECWNSYWKLRREHSVFNLAPAGPEVLMAAALFPRWVASWDGRNWPYPNLAGYQFRNGINWWIAPYMDLLSAADFRLRLCVNYASGSGDLRGYASPMVRNLSL